MADSAEQVGSGLGAASSLELETNPSGDPPVSIINLDGVDVTVKVPKMLQLQRDQWGSKVAYILTLVGYAVGFGNIWRFPYQMRENGGLVFLIPYCIMLAVLGIPIFFLELSIGQRRRKGVVYAWKEISPALGGIGIACGCLCFLVGLYYNTLIAFCLSYFFDSFRNPLPWTNCETATPDASLQKECRDDVSGRATKYYWYRRTLGVSEGYHSGGSYNPFLCVYLLLGWGSVYAVLMKGTKSVGTVVYITALFPYLVLVIFFVANCVIEPEKGWLGAYRLLQPDWTALYKPMTWLKAGSQIFFSLNLAEGCLVVFASYSPARNNCHKDAILISLINCGTSLFAALVVFPMIGLLGHRKYEECYFKMQKYFPGTDMANNATYDEKYDIYFFTNATEWSKISDKNPVKILYRYGELDEDAREKWWEQSYDKIITLITNPLSSDLALATKNPLSSSLRDCSIGQEATASGGGTGFVFMGFTEAVKSMEGSNFWCALFFFMMLTLGIDSAFGTVEGVVASLEDLTHWKRGITTAVACGLMASLAILIFPWGVGIYILDLMDQWAANWTYLMIAVLECIAVAWDYGLAKISYDVLLMTGSKPNVYMLLCWKYISPILIVTLLVASIGQYIYETALDGGFKYTAFHPGHPKADDGDLSLYIPPGVMVVGVAMMLGCVLWVPIYCCLRRTRFNPLKDQVPADFPEEELRAERNIQGVVSEADHFSHTEKVIMGRRSLHSLQEQRDSFVKSLTDIQAGK